MLEIVIGIILGVSIGIIVGIIPGMHPNLFASAIATYIWVLNDVSEITLGVLLVSTAVSSNFFEFMKTMFFSIPDESNVISNHPIHQLLMERRGLEAIELISLGCLGSILIAMILLPLGLKIVPWIYSEIRIFVPFILLGISFHLALKDKYAGKALIVFAVSGIFGIWVFKMNLRDPFLPMLTGLFGLGMIAENFDEKIPGQFASTARVMERANLLKGMLFGFLSSAVLSFIPAIGPAQASLIAEEMKTGKTTDKRNIIVSVAGVNTGDVFFSLIALKTINQARSGVLAVMSEIVNVESVFRELLIGLLAASVISYFIFVRIGKIMVRNADKLNMKKIYIIVVAFVSLFVYLVNGLIGVIVLSCAALIGTLSSKLKVRSSQMMGCLIIPTLLFYF